VRKHTITVKIMCLCLAFVVSDTINVGSGIAFAAFNDAQRRATLSTWVTPLDEDEETLVDRTIADDLRRFVESLNKDDGRIRAPYLNGNDVFFNGFFDTLDLLKKSENGVHIGFGGLNNLTLIAHRESRFACLFDINVNMIRVYECVEETMHDPEVASTEKLSTKRRVFVDNFIDRLLKARLLYRDEDGKRSHDEMHLRGQLYDTRTWLGNDDHFKYIEKMIKEERISYACVDILEYSAFAALARRIENLGLIVDTIYLSNVYEWISGDYPRHYPVDDPYSNQIKFITSLSALADGHSHIIESKLARFAQCVIDEAVRFRKTLYIARVKQDPVKVLKDLREYKKAASVQARLLLERYSAAETMRTKAAATEYQPIEALVQAGMTIGERVKYLRLANKLTRKALSKKTGVSVNAIEKMENDRRGEFNMKTVCKLAGAFDAMDPSILYEGYPRDIVLAREDMTLGKRIEYARIVKGLSQRELSALSGVAESTVVNYEKDKISRNKAQVMKKLADALDVEPSRLYTGDTLAAALTQKGMTFGSRLELLRIIRGLTKEELAAASGVNGLYVGYYEHGVTKDYKVDFVKKLCDVLDDKKGFRITPSIVHTGYHRDEALQKIKMTIGEQITLCLNDEGWTQEELAGECRLSKWTVQQYASGAARVYVKQTVDKIAAAFSEPPKLIYVQQDVSGADIPAQRFLVSA
jgi:transcriptional regulator with XRE-family HTH domain